MTSGIKDSHTPVRSLVRSVLHLQHEICILQPINTAGTWQRGNESVHFLAWYSFLHCWAGLNEAQMKWQSWSIWSWRTILSMNPYTLAITFTPWVGTCTGIVKPFKHLLTAHPNFSEVWAASVHGRLPGTIRESSLGGHSSTTTARSSMTDTGYNNLTEF